MEITWRCVSIRTLPAENRFLSSQSETLDNVKPAVVRSGENLEKSMSPCPVSSVTAMTVRGKWSSTLTVV